MSSHIRASLLRNIAAHQGDVNGVSLSSKLLATCSSDKTVRIFSVGEFTELACSPLKAHTYHVHCCEFSPFETALATCSTDGKVILWDTKTFDKLAVFQHPSNQCIRVCRFSSNSCLLATGGDDMTLCLWDIGSKALVKTLEGHETAVVACAFSPDTSYIVSGSKNGDLRVWDARFDRKNCLFLELDGHDLGVACCAFSSRQVYGVSGAHQLLTTSGYDKNVKLWLLRESPKGPKLQLHKILAGHNGPVHACAFSTDGELIASVSGDKTLRLWSPDSGVCLAVCEAHSRYVTCVAFSPDRQYLATGSNDKTVAVWQLLGPNDHDPPETSAPVVDLCDELRMDREWIKWTVDQVLSWLEQIGFSQYKDLFKAHAIDGQELESLSDLVLKDDLEIKAVGHRNKLLRAIQNLGQGPSPSAPALETDPNTPNEFLCPITCEIMSDPVIVSDGYTYERSAIKAWLTKGSRLSPMSNAPLQNTTLTPNRSLKLAIQRYLQEKQQ